MLGLSALGATAVLAGGASAFLGPMSDDIPDWTMADMPPQAGRKVLVTGGNGFPQEGRSGLGYHVALAFARSGAEVTIASRDQERGQEAVRQMLVEAPGSTVRFETLDLANLASVHDFANRMRMRGDSLDVLVNNAGVMGRAQREVSVDGFERVFATNTLGHFVLTARLLPLLRRGDAPRIVSVSSSRMAGALPFNDLQLESDYDYAAAYDNTKLANLLLAFELERRSRAAGWGVTSLAAHPGVARTNLIPDGPGLDSAEGWRLRMLPFMFQPAIDGALPILYAASSLQAAAGGYYGPNGPLGMRGLPGRARAPDSAQNLQQAETLWSTLERLGQISFA